MDRVPAITPGATGNLLRSSWRASTLARDSSLLPLRLLYLPATWEPRPLLHDATGGWSTFHKRRYLDRRRCAGARELEWHVVTAPAVATFALPITLFPHVVCSVVLAATTIPGPVNVPFHHHMPVGCGTCDAIPRSAARKDVSLSITVGPPLADRHAIANPLS